MDVTNTDPSPHGSPFQPGRRQYVKFTFFKVAPEWRRLDPIARDQ